MKRLLLYFSYIGTNYQGVQRLFKGKTDLNSVQGLVELGFQKLFRAPLRITISSRTDTGVHALESTGHIDIYDEILEKLDGPFSPEKICWSVNSFMEEAGTDIRLRRVVEVDTEFHCRFSAKSRSYCYRIAVCKEGEVQLQPPPSVCHPNGYLPISELYRCQAVPQPFDVEAVSEACSLFLGTWNFRSFMMTSRETKDPDFPEAGFVKTLKKISLSKSTTDEIRNCFDPLFNKFDFYDFNIESSGFLRRQVRRMVGSLLTVGRGDITSDDILFMLKNPSEKSWQKVGKCQVATADGLFLKSVNYGDVPVVRGSFF